MVANSHSEREVVDNHDHGVPKAQTVPMEAMLPSKGMLETMPIAVVGMACRFPGGANDPEKLWNLVSEGRSTWSPIDPRRFNKDGWYHPDERNFGTFNVKGAHFLDKDIGLFDASFFNFTAEIASIPRALEQWPTDILRRASVNNFGYGGANAHAIVEHPDYLLYGRMLGSSSPSTLPAKHGDRRRVFVWSAKDNHTIECMRSDLHDYLCSKKEDNPGKLLDSLAYTLGARRSRFSWVMACSAGSVSGLVTALDTAPDTASASKGVPSVTGPYRSSKVPRLGFVFSGQGAQWYAMGRELLGIYPVFKDTLVRAEKCMYELGGTWSLLEELQRDETTTNVNEVLYSLPMSVAIQLALIELLKSWGVRPAGVTGHSSGEISAAYAAGAIDFKAAMAIVYCRGDLTDRISKLLNRNGTMIAVGLGREGAEERIGRVQSGELMVACVNSPSSVTVSGDLSAVQDLQMILQEENVFARRLKVSAAYHSRHMLPIAEPYFEALRTLVRPKELAAEPVIFSSPVTGRRVDNLADLADPAHWVRNMVQPVEFLDCLTHLCVDTQNGNAADIDMLVEVGPHAALGGPIKQTLKQPEFKGLSVQYASCLNRGEDAVSTIHSLVSILVQNGYPVDLNAVNFPQGKSAEVKVLSDLPPYPWNHQTRYWKEPRVSTDRRNRPDPPHDLLGRTSFDFSPLTPYWRWCIRRRDIPWVCDHVIQGSVVFPGAGYISMAIEAIRQTVPQGTAITGFKFESINILQALVLEEAAEANGTELRLTMRPCIDKIDESQGWNDFHIQSFSSSGQWIANCEGRVGVNTGEAEASMLPDEASGCNVSDLDSQILTPEIYEKLSDTGLEYGPLFQNQVSSQKGEGHSRCVVRVADTRLCMPYQHQKDHIIHPTTLDTVFQAAIHTLPALVFETKQAMVPKTIKALFISADISSNPGHEFEISSRLRSSRTQGFESCATVKNYTPSGPTAGEVSSPLIILNGLYCQAVGGTPVSNEAYRDKLCFTTTWKPDFNMLEPAQMTSGTQAVDSIYRMVELLCHKTPLANILEIGAAQGEFTGSIMKAFVAAASSSSSGGGQLNITDPASQKVEHLRGTFGGKDNINYQVYLAHDDCKSQGLQTNSYDLVIATSPIVGIDGSDDAEQTLKRIRSLLKDGGRLVMRGSTKTSTQDWADVLQRAGFEEYNKSHLLAVATAAPTVAKLEDQPPALSPIALVHSGCPPPASWVKELSEAIKARIHVESISVHSMDHIASLPKNTSIVFLGELDAPVLDQPTAEQFSQIHSMLLRFHRVLWLSHGAQIECLKPFTSLHHGLLRTLRCEDSARRFVSLDLDPEQTPWDAPSTGHITAVLGTILSDDVVLPDVEYAVRRGVVQIPRIAQDFEQNNNVATSVSRQVPEMRPFFNSGMELKMTSTARGMLENLVFVEDQRADGPLPNGFIDIEPRAYGLNFRDLMVALDQLESQSMGFEYAGVITRVSPAAQVEGFEVGDRIYGISLDCFSTTVRVEHIKVAHLPDSLGFAEGASLPLVHATAYYSLCDVAQLQPGESVLIHSASGGVGQSAIMIAQNVGAEIFATVGSEAKRQFVKERYGIPDDHIFSSHSTAFVNDIMERTGGKGVDVIINSLGAPSCERPGARDIELNTTIGLAPFKRCTSFTAIDLLYMYHTRPAAFFGLTRKVAAMITKGELRPVHPVSVFPMADYQKAYRIMKEGKHMGKIVLKPGAGDLVKVISPTRSLKMSPKGSYLIVGGLGGIGKSVAQMLVDRGARRLILMSRSAASPFCRQCRVRVEIELKSCDVSKKGGLAKTLTECADSMLPIKGVIQSAMVLRDALFDDMTHHDYRTVVDAKVQATWNLHELVPGAALEFFIMLSSISGVGGNMGQANYSAGGTFQDALAKYRSSLGLPAVSIDLGAVKGVGVLAHAENAAVAAQLEKAGLRALDESEVLRLIESAIRFPTRTAQSSQIITGMPPSFVRSTAPTFWNRDPRWAPLEVMGGEGEDGTLQGAGVKGSVAYARAALAAAKTTEEAHAVVLETMVAKLAKEFDRSKCDIAPSLALTEIGVDSLTSVELRNWIISSLDTECSIFEIMQSPSLVALVDKIVSKSRLVRLGGAVGEA
ncbi:hypothetical protein PG995_004542 [Apiospora arundinis]